MPVPELLLVFREEWDAQPPVKVEKLTLPATHVFDVDTGTPCCMEGPECRAAVRQMQYQDMFGSGKRHLDIRYNFVIGGDGRVYEGRGWSARSVLPSRYKEVFRTGLLVGFIGRYSDYSSVPNNMLDAWEALIRYGVDNNFIQGKFIQDNLFRQI